MNMQANPTPSPNTVRSTYVRNRWTYTLPRLGPEKLAKLHGILAFHSKNNPAAIDAFLDREYAMHLSGLTSNEDYLMSQALFAIPVIMDDPVKAEKLLALQLAPSSEENRAALQAYLDLEYAMMLSCH